MVTHDQIRSWCPQGVFDEAQELERKGEVLGAQMLDAKIVGTLRNGAGRRIVAGEITGRGIVPNCSCPQGRRGEACVHIIAVALHYLKAHPTAIDSPDPTESHKAISLTPELIQSWSTPELYKKAESLLKAGGFWNIQRNQALIKGHVPINDRTLQEVSLKILSPRRVKTDCPCYTHREDGLICEHALALAIYCMKRENAPARLAAQTAERTKAARLATVDESAYIQRSPKGILAKLVIGLASEWVKQFRIGKVSIGVRIQILRPNQKAKICRPEEIPPGCHLSFSSMDEAALGLFEEICEGPFPAKMTLDADDFAALLRLSRGILLLHNSTPIRCVETALETAFHPRLDPASGDLQLALEASVQGDFLVAKNQGFLFTGHQIYPLKRCLPAPYWDIYRHPIVVPRANVYRFCSQELKAFEALLAINYDDFSADLLSCSPGNPKFKLTIAGSLASIGVQLEVTYQGQTLFASRAPVLQSLTYPDPADIYHYFGRNPAREAAAFECLRDLGFYGDQGNALAPVSGSEHQVLNRLGGLMTTAIREGWQIEIVGRLKDLCEDAQTIMPIVQIEDSHAHPGDFNVSYTYEVPTTAKAISQPEIHRAIQRKESYIKQGNQIIFIDTCGVGAVQAIFEDCPVVATDRPGQFRVPARYAPYVKASLDELSATSIDYDAPKDWRKQAQTQNRDERLEPFAIGPLDATLRPYQKEGVYWLRFLEKGGFSGILADEMGLGKTLQTLTWLDLPRIKASTGHAPALIICPTSLVENWHREAMKFIPHRTCLVLSGPNRKALFGKIPSADIVITSYALIRRDLDVHMAQLWGAIVLDEAQAIKNRTTQNAIAVKRLQSSCKLVLSGTPIENGVSDLWSIMDFLMPGYLGGAEQFKANYQDTIELGGRQAQFAQDKLRKKLHPFLLRRLKTDVAKDLPPKITQVSYCALSPCQQIVYNQILEKTKSKMSSLVSEKGFSAAKMEIFALLAKLRQVCCDLRLIKDPTPRIPANDTPSTKLDQVLELLQEAQSGGHRVLLFSQFTSMLKLIAETLTAEQIPFCYLDGSTKNRLEQCVKFNTTPTIPIFLISLKAGGTGLNLTGADTVIHFDPWWNPAAENQATDRAHRIGQKKTVNAIKLITLNTIEERVLEMQTRKQALIDATIGDADAQIAKSLTWDDIRSIVGID